MTERVARLRIRSVRMKNGGASVRVLHNLEPDLANDVRGWLNDALGEHGGGLAGFAFVLWDGAGNSTCTLKANAKSRIPGILIADFVKSRLLAERIVEWAVE